ncbi:hypothetical protein D3C85_1674820 [compost metagenome]
MNKFLVFVLQGKGSQVDIIDAHQGVLLFDVHIAYSVDAIVIVTNSARIVDGKTG